MAMSTAGCEPTSSERRTCPPQRSGFFTFAPAGRTPLPVYYARGHGRAQDLRVLVVMHGTERNGGDYRDAWAPLVAGRPIMVIVPEFGKAAFPGLTYNLGGMGNDEVLDLPQAQWLFGYIEPLVAQVQADLESSDPTYDIFGHSAGAQFVHRYVEFGRPAHLRRAIAANAGWYTVPAADIDFPYGLRGAPAVDARSAYGTDLTVLLGSNDLDSENLRQDAGAMAQGATRLARGHTFFEAARADAARRHLAFRWSFQTVPGVAHDYIAMSEAAAPLLDEAHP